jgi:gamma-glutamyl:cysteine ligase YbdK (ATP-grasp superfamily)
LLPGSIVSQPKEDILKRNRKKIIKEVMGKIIEIQIDSECAKTHIEDINNTANQIQEVYAKMVRLCDRWKI